VSAPTKIRVPGFGTVTLSGPQMVGTRVRQAIGESLEAESVTASIDGLEIRAQDFAFVYQPLPASPASPPWRVVFSAVVRELFWGQSPPFNVRLSGCFLPPLAARWGAEKAKVPRRRGQPRRTARWNDTLEQFYALVLQRRQEHGESLRDAIDSTAKLEPACFRKAFGGKPTGKRIEAAAQYCKRHARDHKTE